MLGFGASHGDNDDQDEDIEEVSFLGERGHAQLLLKNRFFD